MLWEHMQRQAILKVWKENGMTEKDIGIVGDPDEVFTRDFLLAAQTCDIPHFRPNQNCKTPKVIAKTISFEMSAECIKAGSGHHPDMIIGECIEGIGPHQIAAPARDFKNSGCRKDGFGRKQKTTKQHLFMKHNFHSIQIGMRLIFDVERVGNSMKRR